MVIVFCLRLKKFETDESAKKEDQVDDVKGDQLQEAAQRISTFASQSGSSRKTTRNNKVLMY